MFRCLNLSGVDVSFSSAGLSCVSAGRMVRRGVSTDSSDAAPGPRTLRGFALLDGTSAIAFASPLTRLEPRGVVGLF